jgi:hypothetical protein
MIKTAKGNIQVDVITIHGMKRSPIVIAAKGIHAEVKAELKLK